MHETVQDLTAKGAALGVYTICGTQRSSGEEVPAKIKINLQTRICFAVPAVEDSRVALGFSGAEKLPKKAGRFIIRYGSKTVTGHTFSVDVPDPHGARMSREEQELAARAMQETGGVLSIPTLVEWGYTEWTRAQSIERLAG